MGTCSDAFIVSASEEFVWQLAFANGDAGINIHLFDDREVEDTDTVMTALGKTCFREYIYICFCTYTISFKRVEGIGFTFANGNRFLVDGIGQRNHGDGDGDDTVAAIGGGIRQRVGIFAGFRNRVSEEIVGVAFVHRIVIFIRGFRVHREDQGVDGVIDAGTHLHCIVVGICHGVILVSEGICFSFAGGGILSRQNHRLEDGHGDGHDAVTGVGGGECVFISTSRGDAGILVGEEPCFTRLDRLVERIRGVVSDGENQGVDGIVDSGTHLHRVVVGVCLRVILASINIGLTGANKIVDGILHHRLENGQIKEHSTVATTACSECIILISSCCKIHITKGVMFTSFDGIILFIGSRNQCEVHRNGGIAIATHASDGVKILPFRTVGSIYRIIFTKCHLLVR